MPDYLNGDPIPADALGPGVSASLPHTFKPLLTFTAPLPQKTFDLNAWFEKHGSEQTRPPIDKVIAGLRAEGVTKFGATGYCFGGMSFSREDT